MTKQVKGGDRYQANNLDVDEIRMWCNFSMAALEPLIMVPISTNMKPNPFIQLLQQQTGVSGWCRVQDSPTDRDGQSWY